MISIKSTNATLVITILKANLGQHDREGWPDKAEERAKQWKPFASLKLPQSSSDYWILRTLLQKYHWIIKEAMKQNQTL